MLTIKVNDSTTFQIDNTGDTWLVNGQAVTPDSVQIDDNTMHVLYNNKSYTIERVGTDETGKNMTLKINGIKHQVQLWDEMDELLRKMGLDKVAGNKINNLKAPMPGLVLRMMVTEGQRVEKGDTLLVLEAMKMENVIKSPGSFSIKKIAVTEKTAVEKNQLLIEFGE
jgi:biotin carboxyl carrier protein